MTLLPAAIIVVTTTVQGVAADGLCSLAEAIHNANAAGTVHADCAPGAADTTIQLAPTTYVLDVVEEPFDDGVGLPVVTGRVTIDGQTAIVQRRLTEETPPFRLFAVAPGGHLTLRQVLLLGGIANPDGTGLGGGAILNQGTLVIDGAVITGNASGTDGGGIATSGTATIAHVQFRSNTAFNAGGALRNRGGRVSLTQSAITSNQSVNTAGDLARGGGLANHAIDADATLTVTSSGISGNASNGVGGGGIDNAAASGRRATLTIADSSIEFNVASGPDHTKGLGGGIQNSMFRTANNVTADVTLVRTRVRGNLAVNGGGISNGIDLQRTFTLSLLVDSSVIDENRASGTGFVVGNGGGLYLINGSTTLVNSTISGNAANGTGQASGLGGGVLNGGLNGRTATLAAINTTFAENAAVGGGAALANFPFNGSATSTLTNSLFARNAPGVTCVAPQGGLVSGGHNLEDGNTCGLTHPDDLVGVPPLAGRLRPNGAPSLPTHALLPGSPAIDAGDAAVCGAPPVNGVDQRGVSRAAGAACDIGAYESTWAPLAGTLDTAFLANDSTSGTRRFSLLEDSTFVDDQGGVGGWVPLANPAGLFLRYAPSDGCRADWSGRFNSPATLTGGFRCADGSGTTGVWGGRLSPP
jgi:hypothetical protein